MRTLANGIVTHYALDGPAGAPVITMSNSLMMTLEMWEPQLPALARNYRVLRYDTRGHGGSEVTPGAYSLELLADDVLALLEVLGIERTHFVGLSLGGMIGQAMAFKRPEVLGGLVLADTSSRIPPETQPQWDERIEIAQTQGMIGLVETTVERWFTAPFRTASPEVVDGVRMIIRTTPPLGLIGCAEAIRRLDFTDRLNTINVPTLIIVGEHDPGTPVAAAQVIHEGIAGSRLEIFESAAHLTNYEQAERFNQTVASFLDDL